jgi:hypothetical protein
MKFQDRFELDPPQNSSGAKAHKKFENRNGSGRTARSRALLRFRNCSGYLRRRLNFSNKGSEGTVRKKRREKTLERNPSERSARKEACRKKLFAFSRRIDRNACDTVEEHGFAFFARHRANVGRTVEEHGFQPCVPEPTPNGIIPGL